MMYQWESTDRCSSEDEGLTSNDVPTLGDWQDMDIERSEWNRQQAATALSDSEIAKDYSMEERQLYATQAIGYALMALVEGQK